MIKHTISRGLGGWHGSRNSRRDGNSNVCLIKSMSTSIPLVASYYRVDKTQSSRTAMHEPFFNNNIDIFLRKHVITRSQYTSPPRGTSIGMQSAAVLSLAKIPQDTNLSSDSGGISERDVGSRESLWGSGYSGRGCRLCSWCRRDASVAWHLWNDECCLYIENC